MPHDYSASLDHCNKITPTIFRYEGNLLGCFFEVIISVTLIINDNNGIIV
jgi:hypothetical protein